MNKFTGQYIAFDSKAVFLSRGLKKFAFQFNTLFYVTFLSLLCCIVRNYEAMVLSK